MLETRLESSASCDAPARHWLRQETAQPSALDESVALGNLVGHWWFGSQRQDQEPRSSIPGSDWTAAIKSLMPWDDWMRGRITFADSSTGLVVQTPAVFGTLSSGPIPDLFRFERADFLNLHHQQCPLRRQCLGAFLQLNQGVRRLNMSSLATLESEWLPRAEVLESSRGIGATPLYFTAVLHRVGAQLGRDLAERLRLFPRAGVGLPGRRTRGGHLGWPAVECVVHYRVGDFLAYRSNAMQGIAPWSIAAAVRSFEPVPSEVLILDGGASLMSEASIDRDAASVIARSLAAVTNLTAALRATLPPHVIVRTPTSRRSSDDDLLLLATARRVVTTGASFGLVGALAGLGADNGRHGDLPGWRREVRTPACDHHLDLVHSRRARHRTRRVASGWDEYEYDLVDLA